ncbi:MAG: hypothetical protein H0U10_15610 [Chloroflexia bacterium]|nr:hypothetical protein [Chloroflexia bacterium]
MDEQGQGQAEAGTAKDPGEQESLARDLAAELADIFAQYVRGDLDFAETSFATFDVLQDLHVVATGAYELVEDDDTSEDEDEDEDEDEADGKTAEPYSDETAAEQQEDLSGEPAR